VKIHYLKGNPPEPREPEPGFADKLARFQEVANKIVARAADVEKRQKENVEKITDPVLRESIKAQRKNLI
jgi:hypothetical protein